MPLDHDFNTSAVARPLPEELVEAVKEGSLGAVQELLRRSADVNGSCKAGDTALMWAASKGNKEMVLLLLESGADPTIASQAGYTAAHFASRDQRVMLSDREQEFVDILEILGRAEETHHKALIEEQARVAEAEKLNTRHAAVVQQQQGLRARAPKIKIKTAPSRKRGF